MEQAQAEGFFYEWSRGRRRVLEMEQRHAASQVTGGDRFENSHCLVVDQEFEAAKRMDKQLVEQWS